MANSSSSGTVVTRRDFSDGTRLDLDLGVARYPIFLAAHPAKFLAAVLSNSPSKPTIVLICDENTAELFGLALETNFITAGWNVEALTVPAGETVKSWAVAGELLETLARLHADREVVICSLGGGMVSDLAGFVASIWQRGVRFVQIPTTLLALVDAAVGGKTAVNLSAGKNLVGSFKQPAAIATDLSYLQSLPEEEYRSGLAEAAKHAVLAGEELLQWTEAAAPALLAREQSTLHELIIRNIEFKAGIVASDPRDKGPRIALNYGHTLGHALEALVLAGTATATPPNDDQSSTTSATLLSHGQAVAEGMRFAARIGIQVAGVDPAFVHRQDALLDALGLPALDRGSVHARDTLPPSCFDPLSLRDAMLVDKKTRDGRIHLVLVTAPGKAEVVTLAAELLFDHLRARQRQAQAQLTGEEVAQ